MIEGEPEEPLGAQVPEALRSVVERCLRKKPEQRFESTASLLAALEELQTRAPVAIGRGSWLAVGGVVLSALAAALFM